MSLFPLGLLLSTIAFYGTPLPGFALVPNTLLPPSLSLSQHGSFLSRFRRRRRAHHPNYFTPPENRDRDIDAIKPPIDLDFDNAASGRKYSPLDNSNGYYPSSHIVSVKSNNLAGMMASNDENDDDGRGANICIDFGSEPCFVAVTGESGTGKSLLISKAIDLLSGGKAVASFVPQNQKKLGDISSSSSVEMIVKLFEPHLSAVSCALQSVGVDPSILFQHIDNHDTLSDFDVKNKNKKHGQLHAKRILHVTENGKLKSTCRINNKHLSLKSLRKIVAPLFTRVDVGIASAALGRPASRLAMIDMGVSDEVKSRCRKFREEYKAARKYTMKLKRDLESRVLPPSLEMTNSGGGFDEEQLKSLEHWIDELDEFETRIMHFCDMILTQYNELLSEEYSGNSISGKSTLTSILEKLKQKQWIEKRDISEDASLFSILLEFREEVKSVEALLVSAQVAYDRLSSPSSPDSAMVALENVRNLLYDITRDDSGPLVDKVEETHELLNAVETSLNKCARSIDGNSDSLISVLQKMMCTGISIEMIDGIIADWNSLARKHGISPYSLPNCHASLRDELDGNVEALNKLPEAEKAERIALDKFSRACRELSDARVDVASALSQSVSDILPVLGLEGTSFQVKMKSRQGGFNNPYYGSDSLGVDLVDFFLLHKNDDNSMMIATGDESEIDQGQGGRIELVGSSGEKSRVLLAIETVLPGSIGSICNGFNSETESENDQGSLILPISVIYDEIDAHVGGRAAVTMAKLLAGQSRTNSVDTLKGAINYGVGSKMQQIIGRQIIAITHNASVAAIADRHVVIERSQMRKSSFSSTFIQTRVVDGASRRKEIARMASGDLVPGEAEAFADALIRDAFNQKDSFTLDSTNLSL